MPLKLRYALVTIGFFVCLSLSLEKRAYAYVDPGSSLLAFQSVSALLTGAAFYFRRRLKAFFTRSQNDQTTPPKEPR
jgi:hypothetical protein